MPMKLSSLQARILKALAAFSAMLLVFYLEHGKQLRLHNPKEKIELREENSSFTFKEITVAQATSLLPRTLTTSPTCPSQNHLLFLKTHKTGSSTMVNIFFRYGDFRNLSFVLPSFTLLGWPNRFHAFYAHRLDNRMPNVLCSHSRFNKKPMNNLFPKETSKYLTILRNPVDNFESVFNYMQLGKRIGLCHGPDCLQLFLSRNGIPFKTVRESKSEGRLFRNPMLHDLGLSFKFYQNRTAVQEYIRFLDDEFDLVLIMDHFDESLVLMKRLLCWNMDDILYLKLNERQDAEKNAKLTQDVRENIKSWNKADVMLFEHFNKSLWEKIENQGDSFRNELAIFREKTKQIRQACVTNVTNLQHLYGAKFVKGYSLKNDLPEPLRILCAKMIMSENAYLNYLREKKKDRNEIIKVEPMNYTEIELEINEDEKSWELAKDLVYKPV